MRLLWLIPAIFMIGQLGACEKLDTRHKKTVEERLLDSFADSGEKLRARVGRIVVAAENRNYEYAMNELAVISNTMQLETPQKKAIDDLMRQLRYDLEERDFGDSGNE